MNRTSTYFLIALLAIATPAMASQSKYLGNKIDEQKTESEESRPKVNLLTSDFIERNSHLMNRKFWQERDLSRVIGSDNITQEPSVDELDVVSSMAGGGAFVSTASDYGHDGGTEFMGGISSVPKTAVMGNDHHHNYSQIESQFEDSHNPLENKINIDGRDVFFKIDQKKWAIGSNMLPVLASDITVLSDFPVSYINYKFDVALAVSQKFIDSLFPISRDNVTFSVLNHVDTDLANSRYKYASRDICVKHNNDGDSLVVRMNVLTESMSISSVRVFSGMKCGD